ncbi:Acyl transferase domain-containing protein [Actinomadura madurae]|uniref:Acyl transferase domain-containing protein n=1 Tax=Actinomadura madurae TaxID=1993 RepID=A0A1I5TKK3_9ACTN|nr:type I polyketide synthase [Actinomadura madurae]SFP82876.1 Acyl transferase domain-containing protein [Actinomadura madurae]
MYGESGDAIAIVGMAGRFPGARDLPEFWRNLCAGTASLTRLDDERLVRAGVPREALADPDYVKVASLLGGIHLFEPALFGITPRVAEAMDPQLRVLLEICHDALLDAGYDPYRFGGRIGMYAGAGNNEYLARYLRANPGFMETIGEARARITNHSDYLSTAVSYHLGLRGPSVTSLTACSTSLMTVHMACAALFGNECDMAIAGGVEIPLPAYRGYRYSEGGGMLAADGVVRPYDAGASGTVFGAGAGVVLLKRLSEAVTDRDAIHAVIIGSAVNNDGAAKAAYAAPSEAGQAEVLASALRVARIDPVSVGYVEGHGTGTPVGDPVEVAALNRVYGADRRGARDVALGSVKSNVGHLGAAAGICGLVKAVHSVREGVVPASLNFSDPNPRIDFDGGPFYVADRTMPWPRDTGPRRAAVSSFGVGGTNVHMIVERPPAVETAAPRGPYHLLALSARTPTALAAMAETFRDNLRESRGSGDEGELADIARTLAEGRPVRAVRRVLVVSDREDAVSRLGEGWTGAAAPPVPRGRTPEPAFLMPGQGAQYVGMARGLYGREPEFAAILDHCRAVLRRSHGLDLKTVLFPATASAAPRAEAEIVRTSVTQPALFAVEYALAGLLISWGVRPAAMAGHSVGEYVAAALAGVVDADDALRLVADRGLMIESLPPGAMTAVPLPADELRPLLPPGVDIAAVNAPGMCVVSGPVAAVRELEASLSARKVGTSRLRTSHAFHSPMMEPILEAFAERVAMVRLHAPEIPFVSNVTGDWITPGQATDPAYWTRHVRAPVRFADAARLLLADGGYRLAEVGPGHTLSDLVAEAAAGSETQRSQRVPAVPMMRAARDERDDLRVMLEGVGRLWTYGCSVDWDRIRAHEGRGRVHLPTYPYERESFWVQRVSGESSAAEPQDEGPLYVPTWTETTPPQTTADDGGTWVVFAHPGEAVTDELIRLMRAAGENVVVVSPGGRYAETGDGRRTVRPRESADYGRLAAAVLGTGPGRVRLVHAWLLGGVPARTERAAVRGHLDLGLFSLLPTVQEFSRGTSGASGAALELSVLTSGMQDVLGDGDVHPAKAAVRGLLKTLPRELRSVAVRGVDVGEGDVGEGRAETIAAQLFRELRSGSTEREVALRGRKRWVAGHSAIRLDEAADVPSVLREEGVYVITGGLGGLGLDLAGELARLVRARVVLVGRSGLPPRSEWEPLAAGSPDEALRERLRRVLAVEEAGGRVQVFAGDVADEARMREIRAEAMRAHGRVDGVFHLAGVAGGGLAEVRTQEAVERVLAPKVLGTYVLDRVFRPPLLVLYSSIAAVTGDYGQSDYAGANAVLDAYAQARWGAGRHVVSVNWPQWTDIGMASRAADALPEAYRESAIGPEAAAGVLRSILASGAGPQVVVSPGGLTRRERLADRVAADAGRAGAEVSGSAPAARYVDTPYARPRTDVERKLAALWRQALGVEEVGLDDDFHELGMSSITAVRLVGRIPEVFGVDVSVRELFDWRTLRAASGAVEKALAGRVSSPA